MRSIIIVGMLFLLQNSTNKLEIEPCQESIKTFSTYENYRQNKFEDSLCLSVKKNKFFVNNSNLKREMRKTHGYEAKGWKKTTAKFLKDHFYFTKYCQEKLSAGLKDPSIASASVAGICIPSNACAA